MSAFLFVVVGANPCIRPFGQARGLPLQISGFPLCQHCFYGILMTMKLKKMTKKQAFAFVNGWKAVHEIEIKEMRQTSILRRFQQLEKLFKFASCFKAKSHKFRETASVMVKWKKLKAA